MRSSNTISLEEIKNQITEASEKNNVSDIYQHLKLIVISIFISKSDSPKELLKLINLSKKTIPMGIAMILNDIIKQPESNQIARLQEWFKKLKECETRDHYTSKMIGQVIDSLANDPQIKQKISSELRDQAKILREEITPVFAIKGTKIYEVENSIYLPIVSSYGTEHQNDGLENAEDKINKIKLFTPYLDAKSVESLMARLNELSKVQKVALEDPAVLALLRARGMDDENTQKETIIYFCMVQNMKTFDDIQLAKVSNLKTIEKVMEAFERDKARIRPMQYRAVDEMLKEGEELTSKYNHLISPMLQSKYNHLISPIQEYHNKFITREEDLRKKHKNLEPIDQQKKDASAKALAILNDKTTDNFQKLTLINFLIADERKAPHKSLLKGGKETNLVIMLNDIVSVLKMLMRTESLNPDAPSIAVTPPLTPPKSTVQSTNSPPQGSPVRTPEPLSAEASPQPSPPRDINKPQAWVRGEQKKVDMKEVASKLGEPSVDKLGPPPTLWQAKKAPTAPRDRNVGFFERKPSTEQQANTNEQKENTNEQKENLGSKPRSP